MNSSRFFANRKAKMPNDQAHRRLPDSAATADKKGNEL